MPLSGLRRSDARAGHAQGRKQRGPSQSLPAEAVRAGLQDEGVWCSMSKVDDGLRSLFRQRLSEGVHWQSVESGLVERGIPDANYCVSGGAEGWIEFKATSGLTVDLRPEQAGWLVTRARHGGRVYVAVRRRTAAGPRRGPAVDELLLYAGEYARELRDEGLRAPVPCLGSWSGGPSGWNWSAVRGLLVR